MNMIQRVLWRWAGYKSAIQSWLAGRLHWLLLGQIASALLSLISLVNLIPLLTLPRTDPSYELAWIIDLGLCSFFMVQFVVLLINASDKKHYFLSRGWLDLCSSIMWVDFLRVMRVVRLMHFFKAMREMRGVVRTLVKNSSMSVPFIVAGVTVLGLYLSASIILRLEGSDNSAISSPMDAIWWSVVTVTTVGYGDVVPTTTGGRMVGMVLMIFGVAYYGVISGLLASWLVDIDESAHNDLEQQQLDRLNHKLDRLERKIDQLTHKGS